MNESMTAAMPAQAIRVSRLAQLFIFAAICVLLAELIGTITIPLVAKMQIVLMPLIWAILFGAAWGVAKDRLPGPLVLDAGLQTISAAVLQPALLIFIAKLGLLVGGSLPTIIQSGWALVFQEFGHFFGTMLLGLPVALLLGIKREAIGATFSVGREPSLAIIGEKYGMDSPEGHGVLAEYVTGTVFGAVFLAILAGLITSLGIFNPLALAMGAGVGSGSMMAASAGAIAAQQSPEVAKQVAAFAAAANLITVTIGTYFTLFLSLPFTVGYTASLSPSWVEAAETSRNGAHLRHDPGSRALRSRHASASLNSSQSGWSAVQWRCSATGTTTRRRRALSVFAGLAIITAVVAVGYAIYRLTKGILPAVLWVSFVAMALTYPATPFAAEVAAMTGKINFLALATPVIAFAGLSIAKDIPVFRKLGWRIVVVSLLANAGTFIGAALIAQFFVQPHM